MDPKIVDPTDFSGWDDLILSTPGYSFFHSSAWARVLAESYGYTPLYFTVLENGKLRALVPLMEVSSIITGKRVVSLPFTDYCEPIIGDSVKFQDLLDHIISYGKKYSWKYIELRFKQSLLPHVQLQRTSLVHTLDLTKGEEKIFSNLRDSTRRNIKKAMAKEVDIKIGNDPESIGHFYRLNCMTRRDHGLPPQPYHFFQKVYDHVISKGHGFVILASHNAQIIAGAVFFHFGEKAIYKYGASDKKYQNLRANNLVIWEGIRWFCNRYHQVLCLGRTDLENKGLRQFKMGWRPDENYLRYFRYDLREMVFTGNPPWVSASVVRLLSRMPISVLNLAGSVLYRHVG